jgi:hypothetical protein
MELTTLRVSLDLCAAQRRLLASGGVVPSQSLAGSVATGKSKKASASVENAEGSGVEVNGTSVMVLKMRQSRCTDDDHSVEGSCEPSPLALKDAVRQLSYYFERVPVHYDEKFVTVKSILFKQGKKEFKAARIEKEIPAAPQPSSLGEADGNSSALHHHTGAGTAASSGASDPMWVSDLHWVSPPPGLVPAAVGTVLEMHVTFTTRVRPTSDLAGIYVAGGSIQGQGPLTLATQFEVFHARTAFPCLDVPFIRQRLQLQLTVLPASLVWMNDPANSQGKGAGKQGQGEWVSPASCTVLSEESLTPIPVYVAGFAVFHSYSPSAVAGGTAQGTRPGVNNKGTDPVEQLRQVTASELDILQRTIQRQGGGDRNDDESSPASETDPSSVAGLQLTVIGRKGSNFPLQSSLDILEQSVLLLTDFFRCAVPLRKLDLIVLPSMSLGGMENQGIIFLNEAVGGSKKSGATSGGDQQIKSDIARLIVHEVTHHWLGNWIGLPFSVKEGLCQVLEESIGDVVLGLPMRKRKPATNAAAQPAESGGSGSSSTSSPVAAVQQGKEFTGQTYQTALASTAECIALMGWSDFQKRMQWLVAKAAKLYDDEKNGMTDCAGEEEAPEGDVPPQYLVLDDAACQKLLALRGLVGRNAKSSST